MIAVWWYCLVFVGFGFAGLVFVFIARLFWVSFTLCWFAAGLSFVVVLYLVFGLLSFGFFLFCWLLGF